RKIAHPRLEIFLFLFGSGHRVKVPLNLLGPLLHRALIADLRQIEEAPVIARFWILATKRINDSILDLAARFSALQMSVNLGLEKSVSLRGEERGPRGCGRKSVLFFSARPECTHGQGK